MGALALALAQRLLLRQAVSGAAPAVASASAGAAVPSVAAAVSGEAKAPAILTLRPLPAGAQAQLESALRAYVEQPLELPLFTNDDLPQQGQGNAGRIYLQVGRMLAEETGLADRLAAGGSADEARHVAAMTLLEEAVRSRDSEVLETLWTPKTAADYADASRRVALAGAFGVRAFGERADKLLAEGNLAAADIENRKALAVAVHMAQEWAPFVYLSGVSSAAAPLLREQIIRDKQNRLTLAERIRVGTLQRQLAAYTGTREKAREIQAAAPGTPGLAGKYCLDGTLKRPYCDWSLFCVAKEWTPAEVAAAAPSKARADSINSFLRSGDPRVAAAGQMGAGVLADVQRKLEAAPVEQRALFYVEHLAKPTRLLDAP